MKNHILEFIGNSFSKFLTPAVVCLLMATLYACGGSGNTSEESADTPVESMIADAKEGDDAAASKEKKHPGAKVYGAYCIACHGRDGKGSGNVYPPLVNSEWVVGDKITLISIVINGANGGQYPVNGIDYEGAMTPHSFLSDQEIADVLSYIRSNFENQADPVGVEEVTTVRASLQ